MPGNLAGRVFLAGHSDDLAADDSRWIAARVKDKLNVVVLSAAAPPGDVDRVADSDRGEAADAVPKRASSRKG